MPYLPELIEGEQARSVVEVFGGYNHNARIAEGEWYDDLNLTSDHYPLLAVRKPRSTVFDGIQRPLGIIAKDAAVWVDGPTLYVGGVPVSGLVLSVRAEDCPKQLVSMGAYVCIFPDAAYVNTKDLSDFGMMGASFSTAAGSQVTFVPCRADGSAYEDVIISDEEPSSPANGALWMDTSTEPHTLKQYSASTAAWIEVATTYVRIGAAGIGKAFAKDDGVTVSGIAYDGDDVTVAAQLEQLNADCILIDAGDDYVTVVGILDKAYTQASGSVTVERRVPRMDYVCESGNRLWGCYYGMSDKGMLNEIYACKQNDFRNWNCFAGLSTDSYMVSVGSDGPFTGAIAMQGCPLFFKENYIHKVYGSYPASYKTQDTACRGVQKGSWRSLVIVNETLFYRSRQDVCAYDGALPVGVSAQLGVEDYYHSAIAGAYAGKYYISMMVGTDRRLFVYDTARGIWHRESSMNVVGFAAVDDSLLALTDTAIVDITGNAGTPSEAKVQWSATSGLIGYEMIDEKYVSRFNFRIKPETLSTVHFYIQYDSDGVWHLLGAMRPRSTHAFVLPIIPRRCDHFCIKLVGDGPVKIYSMAKIVEQGSDHV